MAGFVCPKCDKKSEIFRPTDSGVKGFCEDNGLKLLGSLPIDSRICKAMDLGENPIDTDSPVVEIVHSITDKIKLSLQ